MLTDGGGIEELAEHLQRTSPLRAGEARRVVEEVLAWFDEDVESFVRRRHRELRRAGRANPDAFARIAEELETRRVAAPRLTERQIRRVIYG